MRAFEERVHRASRVTDVAPGRFDALGRSDHRSPTHVSHDVEAPLDRDAGREDGQREQRAHHSFADIRIHPASRPEAAAPPPALVDRGAADTDAGAARELEDAFATDFSGVEVSRDGRADALGAQAFAQGEKIHLAAGAPRMHSRRGRALLGHEVAHVVQQRQGRVDAPPPTPPSVAEAAPIVADAALEAEADAVGAQVARGEAAPARMRGASGSATTRAAQGKPRGAPIQMFGALEHKAMGDEGTGHQSYRWDTATEAQFGARDPTYGFTLTHGDIVMLSGDLFDARETDEKGNPIPDNLFALARTPGDHGTRPGTQDEIMYAIYKENPNDKRFGLRPPPQGWGRPSGPGPGGSTQASPPAGSAAPAPVLFPLSPDPKNWSKPYFSEEVKKAVDTRYLTLAARNRDHFVAPEGDKSGGPKSGNFRSAGGSYRAMHETAILAAFEAGQAGKPIDEAMAYEAAAQHYLTDAFASGHLRTPTGSIKTHWDAIYPNFWENLKRFIAHQMAVQLNEEWTRATFFGTVAMIEDDIMPKLEEKVAGYPALGFERLVALATHDVDNRENLKVINDLGERWTAYGDGQMVGIYDIWRGGAKKDESKKYATEAVALGVADIRDAYGLPIVVTDPLGTLQVDGPGGRKYRAEQKMPRVDPEFETTELQGWQAKDLDDLWDNEIRTGSGHTYGAEFEQSAQSGDISKQIADMAAMLDPYEHVYKKGMYLGTIHPQAAFEAGVAAPIRDHTKATLKQIINFNPSRGHAWFNEDDAVMEEIARMEARDTVNNVLALIGITKDGRTDHNSLKTLTLDQRASWIEGVMDGTLSVVSEREEERIVKIFETCPAADRPRLYRMIEGHEWEGDYREGFLTADDDLYNSLSGAELRKVRNLINEGR